MAPPNFKAIGRILCLFDLIISIMAKIHNICLPIIFLYGICSSLRLKCAMCPTVSNAVGTSLTSDGKIDRKMDLMV